MFSHVSNDMTIAREEIFGPVLVMIGYEDDDDAVRIANDTAYGLSGYISGDSDRATRDGPADPQRQRAPQRRRPGDFNAPFGGYRQSGNGREWGALGLRGVPRDQGDHGLRRLTAGLCPYRRSCMSDHPELGPIEGGVTLAVHVQPGAGRTEVVGRHGDALKLRVAAPPAGNRANDAVVELVAKEFNLKAAAVAVTSGASSPDKRLKLTGLELKAAERIVDRLLDTPRPPSRR